MPPSPLQSIKCISSECNATGEIKLEIDKAATVTKVAPPQKELNEKEVRYKKQKEDKKAGRMSYKPKPGYTWNPFRKYPQNLPCYCGSGKKFKKCHRDVLPVCVKSSEVGQVEAYIKKMIAYISELKSEGIVYKTQQVTENNNSGEIKKDEQRT